MLDEDNDGIKEDKRGMLDEDNDEVNEGEEC